MRRAAPNAVLVVLVGAGALLAAPRATFAVTTQAPAAAAEASSAVPPELVPVLERAARYVLDYEQAFRDIAAEETYTQSTGPQREMGADGVPLLCSADSCQRTTRADVIFVRLGDEVPWGTFRDVFEVDGQKVRSHQSRLEALFGSSSPASGAQRVQAILKESARYNIGPAVRNMNFPTLALVFLHPRNQHRFAWKRGGTRRFDGKETLEVGFDETARPALAADNGGKDLPAKGRFWIDPAHGTVVRSETTFRFEPNRARAYVATQYRAEPKLAMWVPEEMREAYEDLTGIGAGAPVFGAPSKAVARYSNFRKFTVVTEDVAARLPGEPGEPAPRAPAAPAETPQPPPAPDVEAPAPPPVERKAPPVAPQTPPPTFPSGVELITVDAVVLDKGGQPVPGLAKDDFVVKEDGRPRDVVSFEAFDLRAPTVQPAAVAPAPAVVASNDVRATDVSRAFAIVIDDLGIAPERTTAAREAVELFLQRSARDGDLVALGTTSGNAWWSTRLPEGREDLVAVLARVRGRGVSELATLDRMSDYEASWIVSHESPLTAPSIADRESVSVGGSVIMRVVARWEQTGACPVVAGRSMGCPARVWAHANLLDGLRRDRVHGTLAGIRRAIEALAPARGRKSVLLLSDGFLDDPGANAQAVVALSREVSAAVYFVDVRGLQVNPGGLGSAADNRPASGRERFEAAVLESAGAVALADDTGGFAVRNTNDLAAGAGRVAAESRAFYLLGFHPQEGKPPGEWRALRVEVKRPGLTVRARRGYTVRSEMTGAAAAGADKEKDKKPPFDPVVARALDSPQGASAIPLRAIAYVLEPRPKDTVHLLVAVELDAGTVAAGVTTVKQLEAHTVAILRDTGRGFHHEDRIAVSAPGEGEPRWRSFTREFELPAGVAQVRVVVRDPATGGIGSVTQRIEIPSPSAFRISTPILTDSIQPASAQGRLPQAMVAAHRIFPIGGGLYCRYEVFGAARAGGALPRVSAGLELRAANGTAVQQQPATPIEPDTDGHLLRIVGTSLEGLPEGDYELTIEVRDETTGARAVRREPFTLGSR